ncbi:quinone oxidoreductase [Dactylosporangium aurantiacum]|uniref:Quinone oxidoreductase n=1 Tax=Dactylosporangium aurantiacum TaxID=35754 RepID=A0A9Q9IIU4_9ACTN|nr:quinone oxidoreductase [Dactylosporangium aurantiacum]MDG6109322.1 quinone oxidoreductase [Dactylosporangium aurantiacum]UWZ56431.1 quinone oxidoreductase [Dactylosporangium aurantiacum]
MRAVVFDGYGDGSVLQVRDVPVPDPGPGQVLVLVEASGVNYMDVYQRTGTYQVPLPFTLGSEGAGTVLRLGDGVEGLAAGDRVAWTGVPGSHAEQAVVPADRLVPVPDGIATAQAAAALLQGLTAHYLTHDSYPVRAGDTVLVHAAAGGVGRLLTRIVTHLGGRVVATAGSEEKREIARADGAVRAVAYEDALAAVRAVSEEGAAAVYDGVGKDTFDLSLQALRPRGTLVLFGAASGKVPPFDPLRLMQGSYWLTRPTLGHFIASRHELLERAQTLFGWMADGVVEVAVTGRYPIDEVRDAYAALEGRRTTGKLLIIP